MRKVFSLFLSLVLLSFTGCGDSRPEPTTDSAADPGATIQNIPDPSEIPGETSKPAQ
jgi:predicted small lipoprotein YifL